MKNKFKGFLNYTEEEYKELWENALFVIDTNILIDLYKYTSYKRTKGLLKVLNHIKSLERLWIPHHVALEYFHNYQQNMGKRQEGYNYLKKELLALGESAEGILNKTKNKYSYIDIEKFNFIANDLNNIVKKSSEKIKVEENKLMDSKTIEKEIIELLDGIIGEPFTQDKIDEIQKLGKDRYKKEIPPGFSDSPKKSEENIRSYGDLTYNLEYGDLIIWFQIIHKALNDDNPKPLIFITEDKKDDWWNKEGRSIIGPHPNLIQEFYDETGEHFYMYRTKTFLKHAKEILYIDMTEEEYRSVVEEVDQIRKREEVESHNKENLDEYFNDVLSSMSPDEVFQFLPESERESLLRHMDKIVKDDNIKDKSLWYRNMIRNAIVRSVNRIEERATSLAKEIALKDYSRGKYYLDQLAKIPSSSSTRGIGLLKLIKSMEHWLLDNTLPF